MFNSQKDHHKQNQKIHFISVPGICEAENKRFEQIIEKRNIMKGKSFYQTSKLNSGQNYF